MDFAERVERLYQNHPRGALAARPNTHRAKGYAWFAREVGVSKRTVFRWARPGTIPHPAALKWLEVLESEAGLNAA